MLCSLFDPVVQTHGAIFVQASLPSLFMSQPSPSLPMFQSMKNVGISEFMSMSSKFSAIENLLQALGTAQQTCAS